jgi:serine/threonine protein kinase
MEYISGGEVYDWIHKTGKFNENEARYMFSQLINALEYMHGKGIYHRDIKPSNLLIDSELNLKVIDFGFSTKSSICTLRKGTPEYMSPEMIESRPYISGNADLFGAAVTLFNMVTGCALTSNSQIDDQFWRTYSADSLSLELKDLLKLMLAYKPDNRLSIDEIKQNSWFNDIQTLNLESLKNSFLSRANKMSLSCDNLSCKRILDGITNLKKSKSTGETKVNFKNTCFQNVKSGSKMIKEIIRFAKIKGYSYKKPSQFHQVQLYKNTSTENVSFAINIIKMKSSNKSKC